MDLFISRQYGISMGRGKQFQWMTHYLELVRRTPPDTDFCTVQFPMVIDEFTDALKMQKTHGNSKRPSIVRETINDAVSLARQIIDVGTSKHCITQTCPSCDPYQLFIKTSQGICTCFNIPSDTPLLKTQIASFYTSLLSK